MQIATRRTTVLADARNGGLSCLPHVAQRESTDERVAAASEAITQVRVGLERAAAEARIGGVASTATAGVVYLVAAGAQGLFSYALFKGGGWVFQNKHPVWGVLFALGTMSSLWAAGNRLTEGR